jgi:small subunit ribosomal protein S6
VRDYELVLVVSPDAGDDGFPATVERVSNFITERGGEIKNVDQWGRRRLAYPIRRFHDGYYAVAHFSADPPVLRPLEASLELAEDILRHLVVRLDELPAPVAVAAPAAPEPEPEPEAEPESE